ncbi:hypothetical protein lacNasYZ03_00280 [Lactobacillus nasalidis]|uniref:Uncharacterized protein n=1 Tax=Lactobacillus nasalidis TaxID=2797258 RepID=A0ABQ3W2L3_9LACO|nr:hypothetical protein [Lactobacillus nasalidis]GHV98514.1 hypothetical protein lacNasYZ01_16960 [Lactobacillus nasalidis]GHW00009.1 hypothetical protein lacNasYZ02_14380 [Lactobacillus nasalidis]GHW00341.1 hypothetical protein lacNasYZ03_00280 [Lactobacillus nasalidis]
MKKLIVASALAVTMLTGLATSPKVQASSSAKSAKVSFNAKVSFKQYKINKKYNNGIKANYYFNLPQLKGNSAAIKKINKDLLKKYKSTSYTTSKGIFVYAKNPSKSTNVKNVTFYDITKTSVSYNKNSIISFKVSKNWWAGYQNNKKNVPYQAIGGWTYSLKSGKLLSITDTAKGNKASIQKKLNAGMMKYFGVKKSEKNFLYDIYLIYYLKSGKLYLYPDIIETLNPEFTQHNPPIYYNSHFTIESRYK